MCLGIESRWGAKFSAPVRTGPGAHLVSCTMGTGSFPGLKRPGRDADPPIHLQCQGLKEGRPVPLPTLRALVAYKGREHLPLPLLVRLTLLCFEINTRGKKKTFGENCSRL